MTDPAARPAPGALADDATADKHARLVLAEGAMAVFEHLPTGAVLDPAWVLEIPERRATTLRVVESLCTVADGMVGTRGSLEEDGPSSTPRVTAAGVYEHHAELGERLLDVPSWVDLRFGRSLHTGLRLLDLRTGVLWRVVAGPDGRPVLRTARFACLARPGTQVLVADGDTTVLDACDQGSPLVFVERRSALGGGVVGLMEQVAEETRSQGLLPRTALARVATYRAGHRRVPTADEVTEIHADAVQRGPTGLLAEQRLAWAARWAEADVEVVGDTELTQALRLALFHIMSSAADHGEAAVGARGLSGPAYAGHVFWDADVFVLPVLAATHPAAARAMLEYRIRRLPEARRLASACGRQGARFPWESAGAGGDVTPTSGVNELGETVPIRTGALEEHITADVAWAAWHFASLTGAWGFLEGPGRALLLDTARYWASRVRFDWDGRAHIDGVIGPDEYHEDVDDNAYTNVLAAWNLRRAADLVEHSTQWVAAENAEVERWRTVADALVTGYDVLSGRHRQFEGYEGLELLLAAELGGVPVAADVVLGERLHASQIIKQADVVMLHHLVPDELPTGSLERDLTFYLPRTAHGSSLSPAVHAAVLARAGRLDEAANLLDIARRIDIDDLTGTTSGGLHLAALGGLWLAVVHGFGGLRVTSPSDQALALDPRLPQGWEELRFRITWHGHPVVVRARHDAVHIATERPVPVTLSGQPITVVSPPGVWVSLAPASASRRGGGIAKEVPA